VSPHLLCVWHSPDCHFSPPLGKCSTLASVSIGNIYLVEVEPLSEKVDEALIAQKERNVIDGGYVVYSENLVWRDVAKHGNLCRRRAV
jgi:hypothetical protein